MVPQGPERPYLLDGEIVERARVIEGLLVDRLPERLVEGEVVGGAYGPARWGDEVD
jgi:hypothetical protein